MRILFYLRTNLTIFRSLTSFFLAIVKWSRRIHVPVCTIFLTRPESCFLLMLKVAFTPLTYVLFRLSCTRRTILHASRNSLWLILIENASRLNCFSLVILNVPLLDFMEFQVGLTRAAARKQFCNKKNRKLLCRIKSSACIQLCSPS